MQKHDLVERLRWVVAEIQQCEPDTPQLDIVRGIITLTGIEPGWGVGNSDQFFEDEQNVAGWYLGEIASVIDNHAWHVMTTMLHIAQGWLDGVAIIHRGDQFEIGT